MQTVQFNDTRAFDNLLSIIGCSAMFADNNFITYKCNKLELSIVVNLMEE